MGKKTIICFLLFLSLNFIKSGILYCQVENDSIYYNEKWTSVEKLLNKGLPKSALETVSEIYDKSKTENNVANLVKAIIYKMSIRFSLDKKDNKIINVIRDEIDSSDTPVKQVLLSMLAEIYWNYFSVNSYSIFKMKILSENTSRNILTWDFNKIVSEIDKCYKSSLHNAESLKKIKIDLFDDLLVMTYRLKIAGGRKLRPTLYDFLIHRAIDFYKNKQTQLTKYVSDFNLSDTAYFNQAEEFVKMEIPAVDTGSFDYMTIKLLQDAVRFHLNDDDPEALIDLEIERFTYLKNYSAIEKREEIFYREMERLENKYSNLPIYSTIIYERARNLYLNGNQKWYLRNEKDKWNLKEAYELCSKGIEKFPESIGAENCRILQNNINEKKFDETIVEDNNLPGKPFKMLVSYKNVNRVYVRVIKTDFNEVLKLAKRYSSNNGYLDVKSPINDYISKSPIEQFSVDLPETDDYYFHKTEIMIPALPIGEYAILTSTGEGFSYEGNAISINFTNITNISYIFSDRSDKFQYYLLDRATGKPLENVDVKLRLSKMDYEYNEFIEDMTKHLKTDKNGYFDFQPSEEIRGFYLEFFYKQEFFFKNDYLCSLNKNRIISNLDIFYNEGFFNTRRLERKHREKEEKEIGIQFFSDRQIYRPGQTVFFKGIILEKFGESITILPDYTSNIYFYSANGNIIDSLSLTSNEYGTISGTFVIPSGGLTGSYKIDPAKVKGYLNISVEEYKRPRFEVIFDNVKEPYRLEDTITVKGRAKTYSGANINDASVIYNITRKYNDYEHENKLVLLNGKTVTDANGEFTIKFRATSDLHMPRVLEFSYNFDISADVTDLNGETRSGSKSIRAFYNSLHIDVYIPFKFNKNKPKKFEIYSNNYNGEYIPSEGKIKISKLKNPEKVFAESKLEKIDTYIYSEAEYRKYFPDEEYKGENDYKKWEVESLKKEIEYNTEIEKVLNLEEAKDWEQGMYRVEMETTDRDGGKVKQIQHFILYDENKKEMPYPTTDWIIFDKMKEYEPGDTAKFLLGSSFNNVFVLYEIVKSDEILKQEWINLSNEKKVIKVPILDEYLGGVDVRLTFVYNNVTYSNRLVLYIPAERKLKIAFETFRNKLQPGEKEEWKIKIKDNKGKVPSAEMVAVLYDKSLDIFRPNVWDWKTHRYKVSEMWERKESFGENYFHPIKKNFSELLQPYKNSYDELNWFMLNFREVFNLRNMLDEISIECSRDVVNIVSKTSGVVEDERGGLINIRGSRSNESIVIVDGVATTNPLEGNTENKSEFVNVETRKDFNETAFFYPDLVTDKNGYITIKFKVPEALTKWKMLGFAHTKDLEYGLIENELITQKEFMVVPNAPRFFREGDSITFTSKITNLSAKDISGDIQLELFDASKDTKLNIFSAGENGTQKFELRQGLNTSISWRLNIPAGVEVIKYKVIAKAADFSDGEEMLIPILPNKTLVTETLPLTVRSNQTKNFKLEKLLSYNSATLVNHNLTLEFTSNPAWYAIQSLPYLMEYPYECSEQIFSRFYANSIAYNIVNSDPKIKAVFESWKNKEPDALTSNLEKNKELKSILIEDTPWIRDAKNESEKKRKIGVLFDTKRMSAELNTTLGKLEKMKIKNSGFSWFDGMPADRYITQHISLGLARLLHLGVVERSQVKEVRDLLNSSINFLDLHIYNDYLNLVRLEKQGLINLKDKQIGSIQIHYLYMRSMCKDVYMQPETKEAFNYFLGQAKEYWLDKNIYLEGLTALALFNYDDKVTPFDIIKSLRENAATDEEMGMYWNDQNPAYNWYEATIEKQAIMIEVFNEIAKDEKAVDEMKIWLLKQKQTQNWNSTKSTVDACYALLISGNRVLSTDVSVDISLGDIKINPASTPDLKIESGSGYFKKAWTGENIIPSMGNVSVANNNKTVSWGGIYWQYFEQLDKITDAETNIKLEKKLYVQKNTDKGKEIFPLDDKSNCKIGDVVIVRIILTSDRDYEYVHMKDMRASCFEPMNVFSNYKYQDGLGYYESTRDASTNFFFDYIPKGVYVFEYPLRISHKGDFSNGIATIQCMYAPEFSAHSEGLRLHINE